MNSLALFLSDRLASALGWMVVHVLWQAALIAFLSAVAMLIWRHKPARRRYWTANAALAAILLSAIATFAFYYGNAEVDRPAAAMELSVQALDKSKVPADNAPAFSTPAKPAIPDGETFRDYFQDNLPLIVTIWLLGMCMFALRLLGNIGYIYYLKSHLTIPVDEFWEELLQRLAQQAGIKKSIQLLESALVRTPMVVGYLKPVILFPIGMINRLEPAEAEAILAHELAHIMRHDYLFNILQSMVETLFYYHPAVWWLSARVRHEREMAADDAAIQLTGNAVQYAKALVAVQDMAFRPLSPSLAFAGANKQKLLHRVQHILHIHPTKTFIMEKLIGAGAIILVLAALGFTQAKTTGHLPNWFAMLPLTGAEQGGVWEGKIENDKVCILFSSRNDRGRWMTEDCFLKSEFSALPTQEAEFTITRPSGAFKLKGKFEGNEGYGRFTFTADKAFADWLTQQGVDEVDDELMWRLFFANADKEYVTSIKNEMPDKQLYGDDLSEMAIHGLDTKTIKEYRQLAAELGEEDAGIDQLLEMKIHDIDTDYARSLAKSGFKGLTLEDVMNAKIHDVDPDYVKQVNAMGYPGLSFEDILNFRIHDITPEYIKGLKDAGITNLSAEELVGFAIHDVTPATISGYRKMGFTDIDNEDIVKFSIHDVDPEFVADMRKAGLADLSIDDLVNLKIHDVDAGYLTEIRKAGFTDFSNDDVVQLKIHDVDVEYIANMRNAGFNNLSIDDLVKCAIHDVDPAKMKAFQQLGMKGVDLDDIVNLHIHDVDPDQIKAFQQLGFKDIDVDDAVNLQIHDVTPDFIQDMRKKGFNKLDLDGYIELKIKYDER